MDHVILLERTAVRAKSSQDRLLASSQLALLYGRCRFGDGQRATSFVVDMALGCKDGFLEFAVRHFKTAVGIRKKRLIMPVVVQILSLSGEAWFGAWLDACAELGLARAGNLDVPLLPCFDSSGRPSAARCPRVREASSCALLSGHLLKETIASIRQPA